MCVVIPRCVCNVCFYIFASVQNLFIYRSNLLRPPSPNFTSPRGPASRSSEPGLAPGWPEMSASPSFLARPDERVALFSDWMMDKQSACSCAPQAGERTALFWAALVGGAQSHQQTGGPGAAVSVTSPSGTLPSGVGIHPPPSCLLRANTHHQVVWRQRKRQE